MASEFTKDHGGRFQAQGGGCNESEKWSQEAALTIHEGNVLLTALASKLSKDEMADRRNGFVQCSMEIKRMHNNGGYTVTDKVIKRSFPPGRTVRVDLEIQRGTAFI